MNEILDISYSDLVFAVPVLESVVSSHGPRVVRRNADDLRASLRIVFTLDTAVDIKYR